MQEVMMKTNVIVAIALSLWVLIILLQMVDFLALHDINNDYLSPALLAKLSLADADTIESWMSCQGEWKVIEYSFILKTLFSMINVVLLTLCSFKLGRERKRAVMEKSL